MLISSFVTFASCIRVFVVLLILVASPSWASAIPQLTLSVDIQSQSLPTLHWADASKVATPDEAKAALVSGDLISEHFMLPQKVATHWFAVTLINPTNQIINPSIYIKQPFLRIANLHYQDPLQGEPQNTWTSLRNGTNIPLKERPVSILSPAFSLSLAPYQEQTYYLEIYTPHKLFRIDLRLGGTQDTYLFDLGHMSLVKMFISASLILSLMNILMYFSFRDKLYLYYCAYSVSLVFTVTFNNILDLYFALPIFDRSLLYLSYNAVVIFFSLFIGKVLDAKRTMPWFSVVLRAIQVVSVLLAALTWYDVSLYMYTVLVFLPVTIFVLGVVIYAAIVGALSTRLLATGIAFFLSGAVIVNLSNFGLIPSNLFFDHAVLFGALIEMLTFSVALFRRVLILNADKHAANSALLHLAQDSKEVLEETVHERTLQLQEANHAKGEFLATINHEMRTPLNGILGMVEMLQGTPSATEQKQQIDHLGSASQQLASLVNEVLDFSKIDENLMVIQAEDFSTHSLVNDLTSLFSISAKQKNIGFSAQVEAGVNEWLHGDLPHIKQVLTNLIGNAIKFTEQGEVGLFIGSGRSSECSIENQTESESESESEINLITFRVTDTGFGMEQVQLKRILSPYYQIEDQSQPSVLKATQVGNTGTGLGLAISEGLTKAMGGSIIVTSELGQGSCFSFTLSLPPATALHEDKQAQGPVPQAVDDIHNCFTGINILLVEDSDINQQVMTTFLQETGCNITVCDTGASALSHYKDHGADIILMDYRLPDTNGLEATQSIRAYEHQLGSQECPIVMHTADNRASLRGETQSVGIDLLLPKPFTQAQLINIICLALEKHIHSISPPLRPNINPKLMPLFGEFVDLNLASITQSRDSLKSGDVETLSSELHKCKGSSGLFGADELHQTVLDMEQKLRVSPDDVSAISRLLTQAEQQLQGYLLWSKELKKELE